MRAEMGATRTIVWDALREDHVEYSVGICEGGQCDAFWNVYCVQDQCGVWTWDGSTDGSVVAVELLPNNVWRLRLEVCNLPFQSFTSMSFGVQASLGSQTGAFVMATPSSGVSRSNWCQSTF